MITPFKAIGFTFTGEIAPDCAISPSSAKRHEIERLVTNYTKKAPMLRGVIAGWRGVIAARLDARRILRPADKSTGDSGRGEGTRSILSYKRP